MTLPRFILPGLRGSDEQIRLTGAEFHHLKVRRLRQGDSLVLIDGAGCERQGVVISLAKEAAIIRLVVGVGESQVVQPVLVLAQALIKAERLELVLEKATELGVARILLYSAERSMRGASEARLRRWQRIIAAAAKQSARSSLPTLEGPLSFEEIISGAIESVRLLIWERAPLESRFVSIGATVNSVRMVIGPEGGFSDSESHFAMQCGFKPISLGSRPLRSETAAISAVVLARQVFNAEN